MLSGRRPSTHRQAGVVAATTMCFALMMVPTLGVFGVTGVVGCPRMAVMFRSPLLARQLLLTGREGSFERTVATAPCAVAALCRFYLLSPLFGLPI